MKTFITTIKFTQQGIKDIDHSTKRAAGFKAEVKKFGAKVKEIYWTTGDHDGLLILEVGNSEVALNELLPMLPGVWVEFEHGGGGVLAIEAQELRRLTPNLNLE